MVVSARFSSSRLTGWLRHRGGSGRGQLRGSWWYNGEMGNGQMCRVIGFYGPILGRLVKKYHRKGQIDTDKGEGDCTSSLIGSHTVT